MHFPLNANNGTPIFEQIARQVTFAVADGRLAAGECVPSIRQLAEDLAVNPNTVAKAYRDLQGDGVLEPIRGTGLAVTADAPKLCRAARRDAVRSRLRDALQELRSLNVEADDVRTEVERELKRWK